MTDSEKQLLERLQLLEKEVEELKNLKFYNDLSADQIVDADYVARLFSISRDAVVNRRFGTHKIPRCREKPVAFRKSDVLRVLREESKTTAEKAAEAFSRAKLVKRKPRKKSIIKKVIG